MNKKLVCHCFAILFALIFILLPLPASDLIIRIYFTEISGDSCSLYYTTDTDGAFSENQVITSAINYNDMSVEFRLDGSLENHITNLRLDFPQIEQLIGIQEITASSAGVIRKSYNPCIFFADENIAFTHGTSVTLVHPRNRAYLSTESDDPHLGFTAPLITQLQRHYSHKVLSRLLICVFIGSCYIFSKKKLFH